MIFSHPTLKACNGCLFLYSSAVIFLFLIKRSRQKAIEIETAFFDSLGNPKGRTLDHCFNAWHFRHNFFLNTDTYIDGLVEILLFFKYWYLYWWVSWNTSEVINENSTSAFNYLDDFSKLTWKYLIDHVSHCKDCVSFIDIRNMMILHAKETFVSKQYEYLFFSVLQSTLFLFVKVHLPKWPLTYYNF